MSVRGAAWCLWLAALAPLCATQDWDEPLEVTWPECSRTNYRRRILSRRTSRDLEVIWLHLDNCNITSLDSGSFMALPNLQGICLDSNNISQLDVSLFLPLTKLEFISLSENRFLGTLPSQLFHNNRKLNRLLFNYVNMSDTPSDLLQGLEELEELYLEQCSLHRVPLFVTQPALKSLKILNLKLNRIQRIEDADTFIHLKSLRYLDLKYNSIEHLHEDILKPLTNLDTIEIDYNRIKYIPNKLFHNHHFRSIGLQYNLIEYIPADAFSNSSFELIDLNHNRLTYLPDTIYPAFVRWKQRGIYQEMIYFLISNPWQCACLNEMLVQFKRRNIIYDSTLLDGRHPVCQLTDGPCIKNTRIALPYS